VLINHADGAILVVKANSTRYNHIDRMLEPLPADRMLGVVLNQSEPGLSESRYNYATYNYQRLELPSPETHEHLELGTEQDVS
jgi:hypothetical protein